MPSAPFNRSDGRQLVSQCDNQRVQSSGQDQGLGVLGLFIVVPEVA